MPPRLPSSRPVRGLACLVLSGALLAGCAGTTGFLPSSGPSHDQVHRSPAIQVRDITAQALRQWRQDGAAASFADLFPGSTAHAGQLGPGDAVEVAVWEAPPATLFVPAGADPRLPGGSGRVSLLLEQAIEREGQLSVPFVGTLAVAGRTPAQVQEEIARRLTGRAHQPQVVVRVVRNVSATATVVGEVPHSLRLPLTPQGERLLDGVAAAGGARAPVGQVTLQLARAGRLASMPLQQVIADPRANVLLQPGDVLTVLHRPHSLVVLGATGQNRELEMEAQGISLAQALGRMNGLQDQRADARAVFVFRRSAPEGPTVYRLDLSDPAALFVAQDFQMAHRDVLYVANAPAAELQKFLGLLASVVGPLASARYLAE